jgi:FkbM family methyltransferase
MNLNYIDLGLHKGDEIQMFLDAVKPLKHFKKIRVFGFEPHPDLFQAVKKRYQNNISVRIFDKAISNSNGDANLYIAESNKLEGNSLFSTKNNVDKDNFVKCQTIILSDWIKDEIPSFKKDVNVLRYNIEGSEIHLFNDLINTGLSKYFNLYLGSANGDDILKCSEIHHLHEDFMNILKNNNIYVHQYCAASINNIKSQDICLKIIEAIKLKKGG